MEQECIIIVIEDDGKGMSSDMLAKLRENLENVNQDEVEVEGLSHVALINIERRIQSYFGDQYGLEVDSIENSGTKVRVILPLKKRGIA